MKATKYLIKADYLIQSLILIASIIASPTVFLAAFGLLVIGGWQLLSALVIGLLKGCKTRLLYFASASTYCGFLWAGDKLIDKFYPPEFMETGFYLTGLFIIPIAAAILYFAFTKKEYLEIKEDRKSVPSYEESLVP